MESDSDNHSLHVRQTQVISNSGHDDMIVGQHTSAQHHKHSKMATRIMSHTKKPGIKKRVSFSEPEASLLDSSPNEGRFVQLYDVDF